MRSALPALVPLLLAACAPAVQQGDMPLKTTAGEHLAMAYFLVLDGKGESISFTPQACVEGATPGSCEKLLGVYADDAHKYKGGMLLYKTTAPTVKVTGMQIETSIFDSVKTGTMRHFSLTLNGLESPLNIPGNSPDYTYYTVNYTADGKGVAVLKAPSCPRVDGVYLGTFALQFKDVGMPMPELAIADITGNNLHFKQAGLVKFRAGETFTCYAIPKNRPKLTGGQTTLSR